MFWVENMDVLDVIEVFIRGRKSETNEMNLA